MNYVIVELDQLIADGASRYAFARKCMGLESGQEPQSRSEKETFYKIALEPELVMRDLVVEGVPEQLLALKALGCKIIVISNRSESKLWDATVSWLQKTHLFDFIDEMYLKTDETLFWMKELWFKSMYKNLSLHNWALDPEHFERVYIVHHDHSILNDQIHNLRLGHIPFALAASLKAVVESVVYNNHNNVFMSGSAFLLDLTHWSGGLQVRNNMMGQVRPVGAKFYGVECVLSLYPADRNLFMITPSAGHFDECLLKLKSEPDADKVLVGII